ncbi:MAG: trehalose-phosphatase [Chloroflexota bacterium]
MMEPLFPQWEKLAAELRKAAHVLLLSDYDGTLTPIVSRPEKARLSPEVRESLRRLAAKPDFTVGIVSGRMLEEIRGMVGIPGIYYAGNHGLEISGPGLEYRNPAALAAQSQVKDLGHQLKARLSIIPGAWVEDKGLSLSVHYRQVREEQVSTAEELFCGVTAPLVRSGKIRVTSGKKVWEVRPPIDWDKGKAAETIRQEITKLRRLPRLPAIYLGDDTTDEDAFRVISPPEGWSIYIGAGSDDSTAAYCVDSPAEVALFLSRLLALR